MKFKNAALILSCVSLFCINGYSFETQKTVKPHEEAPTMPHPHPRAEEEKNLKSEAKNDWDEDFDTAQIKPKDHRKGRS